MSETVEESTPEPPPADAEANGERIDAPSEALKGLKILPPRQRSNSTSGVPALTLPPVRPDEPVQSVRAALSEVVGLAHITNYRLEVQRDAGITTVPWTADLISSFTGKDAVISLSAAVKAFQNEKSFTSGSDVVLDDYGDISSAGELDHDCCIGMVLQKYDAATVLEHVMRLRSLLQGSAPCTLELFADEQPQNETPKDGEEETIDPSVQNKALPPLPEYMEPGSDKLQDYFYLASGEDRRLYHSAAVTPAKPSKKKKKGKNGNSTDDSHVAVADEQELREKLPRWNQLDEKCWVKCQIRHSGFHPPPSSRRWIGDLAYFEFVMPGVPVLHITANVSGFYINRSTAEVGNERFDPSPASDPCYSHALLDCLLQASPKFSAAWEDALSAAKERADLIQELNASSPHLSLFRIAVRGDFAGFSSSPAATAATQSFDATVHAPSWLVPVPRVTTKDDGASWAPTHIHAYHVARMEEDLMGSFGIDLRSGGNRDWNEEFQLAREMPVVSQVERIERARLLYKVMSEFGEAAILGVKAIAEGQITPMNPNESMRTQVYLHNNIFFSRAVDAGPDTFKLHRGDRAARKQANRDIQCNQALYRLENTGISTLATVLVDYLGLRYVCQSVLPGILVGERSHKLILGSVESTAPLKYDEDLSSLLAETIAESMMLASRPVFRQPLTESRIAEIEEAKKDLPVLPAHLMPPVQEKEEINLDSIMTTCVPIEAKGILGSDQRRYLLDIGRFTPRDANWLPESKGGTGKFEGEKKVNGKSHGSIPSSLEDEEWALCVLRSELVHRYTQSLVSDYLAKKQSKELEDKKRKIVNSKKEDDATARANKDVASVEADASTESEDIAEKPDFSLPDDDIAFVKSVRFNVNALLPDIRSFDGIDAAAAKQIKIDEQMLRDAAIFLWDKVLPKITQVVLEGSVQLPMDGRSLTEFLHRNGVNCRYLGRLATLAQVQEALDAKVTEGIKQGNQSVIPKRTMPKYWLELLECEMVARAAKHVLDGYLTEHGSVAAGQPAQTVASFLSAVVSKSEENAGQTETRLKKRSPDEPEDEDFAALAISGVGGGGDAVPSPVRNRSQVWKDIESEVGRRFRYTLTIFNAGSKVDRVPFTSLLRRVCQRTGVRLVAKDYDLGAQCLCSGGSTNGGRLTASYPISPVDVIDILPLVKHMAAFNEGFFPCNTWPVTLPPLQVSLQDARAALEGAHAETNARALNKGLEFAQEACSLFQRVTETPAHPGVVEAVELMATIFHEAGDIPLAISHGDRALSLTIQTGGFDTANVVTSHMSLFQMHYSAKNFDRAVKHLRAGIYLLGTMAGANHSECFSSLHKLGNTYAHPDYDGQYLLSALKYFDEASKRDGADRFNEGVTFKYFSKAYAELGYYKEAVEWEKKAYGVLTMFLGKDHTWAKESEAELNLFTKLAVEKGTRSIQAGKLEEERAKAEAIAADLLAAEDAISAPKKNNANKKKKGKK